MKPATAIEFVACVAGVVGMPYKDWRHAGVIAMEHAAALVVLAAIGAPMPRDRMGPACSGLLNDVVWMQDSAMLRV